MEFTFNQFWWQAQVPSSAWADFTPDKTTLLTFAPEGRDEAPLTTEEIVLATWVRDNLETQVAPILGAVFEAYPNWRRQYFEDFCIEENKHDLPTLTSTGSLKQVIELEEIHVHQISKDGIPYVGYQFSCTWDEEHGLGVLMHGKRVVEMDEAATAFTLWIAERDLDA